MAQTSVVSLCFQPEKVFSKLSAYKYTPFQKYWNDEASFFIFAVD